MSISINLTEGELDLLLSSLNYLNDFVHNTNIIQTSGHGIQSRKSH